MVLSAHDVELYPTPSWITNALLDVEEFDKEWSIWEPACGNGAIMEVLEKRGYDDVYGSDLYDFGVGDVGIDFLSLSKKKQYVNAIITNPPFSLAEQFVHKALEYATRKVAMLLRLAFLEGQGRYKRMFKERCPPTRVHVFSQRVTMYPLGTERKGAATSAIAWFVWERGEDGKLPMKSELRWISPR